MALYNTQGGNSVVDAGSTTLDSSSVVVPAGAVVYAIAISSDGTAVDCAGVSLNPSGTPQAFTQLGSTLSLNANCRASLWRLTNASGVTAVVRATWGSNQTERSIGVWVGTDIDLVTPNETPVTATGTNTTPTATANTGIVSGDLVLSFGVYQWATATPIAFNSPSGTERGEYTTAGYSGLAFQEQVAAGTSVSPQWTLSSTPINWGIFVVPLNDGVTSTREQQGSRFGADDGSESAHTWLAAQDTDVSVAPDTPFRVRLGVQATGDPAAASYQLEWRKVGDSNWTKAE